MEILSKHIAGLLQHHDCVIIPRLGGFVVRQNEAKLSQDDYLLIPPQRVVGFNANLSHNDGLLAESLMKEFDIDFQEAVLRIENETDRIIGILKNQGFFIMNEVGELKLDAEGRIEFFPQKSILLNSWNYALPETKIIPYSELEQNYKALKQSLAREKDVIYISVNKRLLKNIASVAAIILMILCVSFPLDYDIDSSHVHAAMFPVYSSAPSGKIHNEDKKAIVKATVAKKSLKDEKINAKSFMENPSLQNKVSQRSYYIIVGSFPSKDLAEKHLKILKQKNIQTSGIIEKEGRVRLYAAKYVSKVEAEKELSSYKTALDCKDAWIFSCK
ncbi:MAG: SPOR domain-containing protein [Bacteroidales bacterium]|nr:SPOR domain-containing protein [Bacteroidales bacterium]